MSDVAHRELVGGSLRLPAVALADQLEDPNDGAPLGPQRASAPERVEEALALAAASEWPNLDLERRAQALLRLADALDVRAEEIARVDALDSGVPISLTSAIASSLGDTVRQVVAVLRELGEERELDGGVRRVLIERRPWGPAALLAPWNAPAPVAVSKVANALAAGCPTILKPSEHAPQAAGAIAEAAVEAGLPASALQVVHGGPAVAIALASDRRIAVVSLTGSLAAGQAVAAAALPRMAALQLELGASNPALVTEDADIDATAAALAEGSVKLNGQWCEAPRRIFVAAARHDDLVDALRARLTSLTAGSSLDRATQLGPLARRAHRDRVRAQVAALQADVLETCPVPDVGAFLSPLLVPGLAPDAVSEEIFGPVLTLHPVAHDDEALAAANATGDGLAGYIFAGDRERAFLLARRLRAGEIRLGGTHLLDLAPGAAQSFWGTSGIGGHGARETLEAFRGTRVVGEDDPELSI